MWILKIRCFRFFLRFSLRSSLHLVETFYYYYLSFLCFRFAALSPDQIIFVWWISRLDPQTSLSQPPQVRPHQTKSDLRWDHNRPSSDPTTTKSDHQNRPPPPHQTTDHHPWLLSFQSAQNTQPLELVQVRWILYGLGQGGYIELWMNLAKHTFHTLSAWRLRTSFFGLT